ncbi:Cif family virulence factor [Hymenobacter jeollabukensis]|uniref:Nuclear transport factor 2 family protein n=1 Tax=Hymenobacter jeollabukensis TaxID=2025313 RepID=A0A5R8WJW5_9BACT|nr:nuclear transport factor 2 family protein [Hymenobacter jeollabukensis]TLM88922.1 nuclear transport factor 2 family protein [Hymenobacter jeollabukensis]
MKLPVLLLAGLSAALPGPHPGTPSTVADDYHAMVSAERQFAAFTGQNGIKAGFSRFLSPEALVVVNGRYRLGKPLYERAAALPGLLAWEPAHAVIAASGDFGYSTGPFTYRPTTASDSITSVGYFTSVWHRTPAGEWQVLADVGGDMPLVEPAAAPLTLPARFARKMTTPADTAAGRRTLLAAEQAFEQEAAQSLSVAYRRSLAPGADTRLYRNGQRPRVGTGAAAFAAQQQLPMTHTDARAVVAASGDLGFTYGHGRTDNRSGAFLRIWRRAAKGSWQIVHEVLLLQA